MTETLDPESREAVAGRLEAVRRILDIKTQDEFASRANIAPQTYSGWMSCRRDVSLAAARQLKETYGLTLEFIYTGNKNDLPHRIAKEL